MVLYEIFFPMLILSVITTVVYGAPMIIVQNASWVMKIGAILTWFSLFMSIGLIFHFILYVIRGDIHLAFMKCWVEQSYSSDGCWN